MSKDKSQNFTEISLVVPELELFLARNGLFMKCKSGKILVLVRFYSLKLKAAKILFTILH